MRTLYKKNLPKIGTWLLRVYFWGYLSGAIVTTIYIVIATDVTHAFPAIFGILAMVYLFGLAPSTTLIIIMTPIFLLAINAWLKIVKKHSKLETTWGGVILFTFLIGLPSGGFLNIIIQFMKGFAFSKISFHLPLFLIGFFGGWLGTLIPRIFIKNLRPGSLL